ncbi:galactosylgalactosylxylosylprotein 3-beta-glucuronosyltransferase 2-like [Mytilus californianus]|uniref:galactosylgalactosylxylosylprotein 3-beta-glucuronosyltransferase 2-like n=1 Tax=Mytilus californianus TaxID=6549 RepID=UPI00224529F4|nr:galactosylgalactosylxylosylprotein 3-beta-glucuronosyltransferase 2-like [Mytilus californianus]
MKESIQDDIPLIYVITATYNRLVQRADLTRLSNAFRLVKRLHWIVVEPDGQINDIQIFEELRYTKKLSAWPVAFSGRKKYETPIVENGKKLPNRYTINVKFLWKYHPRFTSMKDFHNGFEEIKFLEQCCTVDEIEPRADNCTKILVWHTKTEKSKIDKIDHNVPKSAV